VANATCAGSVARSRGFSTRAMGPWATDELHRGVNHDFYGFIWFHVILYDLMINNDFYMIFM
jgi:hypothetical protein